jgi:hypothetical protein
MPFVGFVLAGCGPNERPVSTASPAAPTASPAAEAAKAPTSSSPGMEQVITSWQNGDKAAAVSQFVQVDWSARPLFPADSPLNLSEDQFVSLSQSDRTSKLGELIPQVSRLKDLYREVVQAGRNAAAKGDTAEARRDFTALKQCGEALDSQDFALTVRAIGQLFKKTADAELASLQ